MATDNPFPKGDREMKERPPAFQFYPRQFAADDHVMALDLDSVGGHILLMCAAAASPERYRIPADERAIRTRLRNPPEDDWQRIKNQLLAGPWKLSEDGVWWEQHGLQRTIEKQTRFSEAQRSRALGGHAKQTAKRLPGPRPTDTDMQPEDCSSSSSSSSDKNLHGQESGGNGQQVSKPRLEASDAGLRLAQLLRSHIVRNNPTAKITESQIANWGREVDRMLRIDHRTEEQIRELLEFSQADQFWLANILSMCKLRHQFDRLTVVRKQKQQKEWGTEIENSEEPQSGAPRWAGLDKGSENGGKK